MIGIAQTDPHKGCLKTFQQAFSVHLRGKLIQVEMARMNPWTWITLPLTKSISFKSEKNIC